MNKKTETAGFPYMDRPMWLYIRNSDKRMFVLIQQMRDLLRKPIIGDTLSWVPLRIWEPAGAQLAWA